MDRNDPGDGVLSLGIDAARQEFREGRDVVLAGQVLLWWDQCPGDVCNYMMLEIYSFFNEAYMSPSWELDLHDSTQSSWSCSFTLLPSASYPHILLHGHSVNLTCPVEVKYY